MSKLYLTYQGENANELSAGECFNMRQTDFLLQQIFQVFQTIGRKTAELEDFLNIYGWLKCDALRSQTGIRKC